MNRHLDPDTLQDLLDGELGPAERLAAEAHLATCETCAAEWAGFRRLFGSLEALPTWDPGPDFTKTPAQTVAVLRGLAELNPSGLPALLALSRKDFIGALTHTRPKERLAGTLAAIAAVGSGSGVVLRVHDVGEVRRFLTVLDVLSSSDPVDPELRLADELRWAAGRPDGTAAV